MAENDSFFGWGVTLDDTNEFVKTSPFSFAMFTSHHCNFATGQRNQLTQETELLESVLSDVSHQKQTSTKNEMIAKSKELMTLFQQIHKKPMISFVTAPVPADFSRYLLSAERLCFCKEQEVPLCSLSCCFMTEVIT